MITQFIHCSHLKTHPSQSECNSLKGNMEGMNSVLLDVDHSSDIVSQAKMVSNVRQNGVNITLLMSIIGAVWWPTSVHSDALSKEWMGMEVGQVYQ